MTGIRRVLTLIGLTLAVMIGASIPASAAFSTSTAPVTTSVTTATVAPATGVALQDTCAWGYHLATSISWTASTSARVTGYTVTAHKSDGTSQVVAGPSATTRATQYFPTDVVSYSVITHTDYGWTAESPRTAAGTC